MTHRFWSEDGIYTRLREILTSKFETDLVTYNTLFSVLNSLSTCNGADADNLRSMKTLKNRTTDVSAHKTFSDVPDGHGDSKYRLTPNKLIHRIRDIFHCLVRAVSNSDLAQGQFLM